MATKKKMLMSAAGSAGGAGLDITDVFSTYLYEGTASTLAIDNGIDLSGEGGLVWLKSRDNAGGTSNHVLLDTERGANTSTAHLQSDTTGAAATGYLNSFNSNGFTLASNGGRKYNYSGSDYASWTFRKAPKFFDIVTYSGTGSTQNISHNLGSVPRCIIVKNFTSARSWNVYHVGLDATNPEGFALKLNSTAERQIATEAEGGNSWNSTAPTDSVFTVGNYNETNENSQSYVAYLFAHNDGDGKFGPDADQDIIKCGSYTGNGTYKGGPQIDLGWEPQWVLIKNTSSSIGWFLYDSMRGITDNSSTTAYLQPNQDYAENNTEGIELGPTGFQVMGNNLGENASGDKYIYMAIRRGPLAVPEDATKVFDSVTYTGDGTNGRQISSSFVTDMTIGTRRAEAREREIYARLTSYKSLSTDSTGAEGTGSVYFDTQDGILVNANYSNYNGKSQISWMWKRAPGFFDVVTFSGDGVAGRTVSHNLGVAPEMMWVKRRDATDVWAVYSEAVGNTGFLRLNQTNAITTTIQSWNNTSPTSSDFTLGDWAAVNTNNSTYIAYLFASVAGVSKISSYTGNGSSQTINCGFTSGARFILIKRTDATGDWYIWDTKRGIVAGNDPHLSLNTTAAEVTTDDSIDPASSGFIVNQVSATNINVSSAEYIFYAIA